MWWDAIVPVAEKTLAIDGQASHVDVLTSSRRPDSLPHLLAVIYPLLVVRIVVVFLTLAVAGSDLVVSSGLIFLARHGVAAPPAALQALHPA